MNNSKMPIKEEEKGFLHNDKTLVAGMFVIYGICISGFIISAFIWLGNRSEKLNVIATATGAAKETQQAGTTETAVAHITEQAQFIFVDRFDSNANLWRAKRENSEYWKGIVRVLGGTYVWNVEETKKTFISWADVPHNNYMEDFDAYVDTKILDVSPGEACSGLLFRVAPSGWDDGGYYFALCNNSLATISYHNERDGWERIETRYFGNYSNDWNRLEIIARKSHFKFFINGEMVYEMDDIRRKGGGLALAIELNEKVPATFWFDNFGLQKR